MPWGNLRIKKVCIQWKTEEVQILQMTDGIVYNYCFNVCEINPFLNATSTRRVLDLFHDNGMSKYSLCQLLSNA
jgi:hypothetical protein